MTVSHTWNTLRTLAVLSFALILRGNVHAANVTKANNADNLNLGSSWVLGTPPTSADVAVWDITVTAANTVLLGADTNWAGITILDPGGAIQISAGNTLTLGASGIDTSSASQALTLACPVVIAAPQNWNIVSAVTVSGVISGTAGNGITNIGSGQLNIGGANGSFVDGITVNAGTVNVTAGTTPIHLNGGTFLVGAALSTPVDVTPNGGTIRLTTSRTLSAAFSGTGTATYDANATATTLSFGNGTMLNTFNGTLRGGANNGGFRWNSSTFNGGDNVTFDLGSGSGYITRNNSAAVINLGALAGASGTQVRNGTATYAIGGKNVASTFSGDIQSTANVIKKGTATLTLDGANTYTGWTVVSNGVLQIGSGGSSGSLASPVVTNYTLLSLNRSDVFTFTNRITGTGTLQVDGSGTATLSGPGGGNGNNDYSGGTILNNGVLAFTTGALGTGGIVFSNNNPTLKWSSGNTTDISSQTVTIGASSGQLDVNGNTVTLANSIGNSGTGLLTIKSTTANGVLILQGANTWSGGTVVSSGTLKANNVTGSATGSGSITVNPGATLAGSGTVSGSVDAQGYLAPGNSVGTLTVGSLTLESSSTNNFEFNSTPANDKVVVTVSGGFTVNGGLFNLYTEGGATPWTTAGTYNLIQFTGTAPSLDSSWTTASSTNPHIANPQTGYQYAFSISGGFLRVTISAVSGANIGTWGVNADGNWSVAGNWTATSGTMPPRNAGDSSTFGTGTALRTVTLDANETNGSITLNNANSFVIANAGKVLTLDNLGNGASVSVSGGTANAIQTAVALNDNANITVSAGKSLAISGVVSNSSTAKALTFGGSGALALSGNNSYGPAASSGFGTTVSGGGTLQIGNNNALGSGDVSLPASGTLQAGANGLNVTNNFDVASGATTTVDNNGNSLTLSGVISDSGSLTKVGNGTLTLAANNTYSGNTTVNAGVLSLSADANVGSSPTITLNGGILRGNTFELNSSHSIAIGSVLGAVGTNALVDAASGQTFQIDGVIASAGNSGANNLIVNSQPGDNGTLVLNGVNTFNGTTTISNGTLQVLNSFALQGSTLDYSSGTLVFDGSINTAIFGGLAGTNNLALTNLAGGVVTLNVGSNNASTTYSGGLTDGGVAGVSLTKSGSGTLTMTGSNSYSAATSVNGGVLLLTNGGVITCGSLNAGALLSINGGTFNATNTAVNSVISGSFGNGLLLSAGTATFNNIRSPNSDGNEINVTGGTLTANDINFQRTIAGGVGAAPTTSGLVVSGGTVNVVTMEFGTGNSSATMNISTNGNVITTGSVIVGWQSSGGRGGVIAVSGGSFTVNDASTNGLVLLRDKSGAGQTANVFLDGGVTKLSTLTFGFDSAIPAGCAATVNISSNAQLYIGSGGIVKNASDANMTSTLNLNGGTLGAAADWSSSHPINLSSPSIIQAADAGNVAHNITLSGVLSGNGGLTKIGNGTLTLSGANTYTNNTAINAGTLVLQQPSLFTNSTVSVASGATLQLSFVGANQVAGLVLNGVSKPAGVYNNSTDPTFLTGTGSIQVLSTAPKPTPYITHVGVSGTTLNLTGTNGALGGQYVLLQSTNVTVPLNQWTPVLTNSFDGSGNFNLSTNIVSPGNPREFYIILQ